MQAVLYHHGVPPRSWLMSAAVARLAGAARRCRPPPREQITIALAMIDAHDAQLAPLDRAAARLRAPPARLPGADAPLRDRAADLDHDPRRARRRRAASPPRARPSATPAWTSPSTNPTPAARPGHLSRQGPPALRWALFEAAQCARRTQLTRPRLLPRRRPHGSAATAPAWPSRASCSSAATTRCANSARRPCSPHDHRSARAARTHADAPRPAPGMLLPPPPRGRPS